MSPAVLDEKIGRFQNMVDHTEQVGVSEFARSKEWRDRLPVIGCFKVTDRSGVIGYMISPDYAETISAKITDLEKQAEEAQISAMFEARNQRDEMLSGSALKSGALSYLDEHGDALARILDED